MENAAAAPKLATVAILADDLIWASRLQAAVERAGASPITLQEMPQPSSVAGARLAIIDLGGRRYDGLAAVKSVVAAGTRVIAVAQHDDQALRRAAREAGARRIYSYNKLFSDGPAVIAGWLSDDT